MNNYLKATVSGVAAAMIAMGASVLPAASEEVTLRAASVWPKNFHITQSFLRYVDKVNEEGKGVVQIQFLGGPEVIPANELPAALRRGAVDMFHGSSAYTQGSVPESDAFVASTQTAAEMRESGAFDLMDEIYQTKLNAKLVGLVDRGWSFLLYLRNEPKIVDGKVDLTGVNIRSHPLYNEFLSSLGATPVVVTTTELYTSFERGMVDGLAFPEVGIRDFNLEKFIQHVVYPPFYLADIIYLVNKDKWDLLPREAQAVLLKTAEEFEAESREYYQGLVKEEELKLQELGITRVDLPPEVAENYLSKANEVPWTRIERADPSNLDALRKVIQ